LGDLACYLFLSSNTMPMINPYLDTLILVFVYVNIWFVLAQILKNNSIVDIAWGLGFVCIAWWMHLFHSSTISGLLTIIVTFWGLRLGLYIYLRGRKKGEDWRYVQMRNNWGKQQMINAYFKVFLLQGFLMWIIALPLIENDTPNTWAYPQIIGSILWLVGFLWESIADWQLFKFKQNPENKGKLMNTGLWRFSRHPNYFGEILLWWGIYMCILPSTNWWWTIIGPLTITWLLTRVSGVPMLEKKYKDNPEYQTYIKSTNSLVPKFN